MVAQHVCPTVEQFDTGFNQTRKFTPTTGLLRLQLIDFICGCAWILPLATPWLVDV